jgi:hypothetical protein
LARLARSVKNMERAEASVATLAADDLGPIEEGQHATAAPRE